MDVAKVAEHQGGEAVVSKEPANEVTMLLYLPTITDEADHHPSESLSFEEPIKQRRPQTARM